MIRWIGRGGATAMYARMKRWLLRLLGVGVLVAAGDVAFHTAKSWPRCVIINDTHILHFSDDGSTILTGHTGTRIGNSARHGAGRPPVKVWDTHRGEVVRSLLNNVARFERFAIHGARHLLAAEVDAGRVCLADWQTGEEWEIDVGGTVQSCWFSANGDLLAVELGKHEQRHVMIDVAKREVIQRWGRDAANPAGFSKDGARWYFIRASRLHAWDTTNRQVELSAPVGEELQTWERIYYWSVEDMSLVVCDSATLAPKARLRLAWPIETADLDEGLRRAMISSRGVSFSPSGQRIATYALHARPYSKINDGTLELWDVASAGRTAAFPALGNGLAYFADDSTLVFFDTREGESLGHVTVIDVLTGAVRWERTATIGHIFFLDPTTAIHADPQGTWEILDAATGRSRRSMPQPFVPRQFMMSYEKERRFVVAYGPRRAPAIAAWWEKWAPGWLRTSSSGVHVVDVRNQCIAFDLRFGVETGGVLSEDGRTLLCYDFSHDPGSGPKTPAYRFRFYDLESNEPWLWAVAVPAGLLSVVLVWRWWRRKRT